MKWNLTGRYLVSILLIVATVIILNLAILFGLLVNDRTGLDDVESNSGETFTRTFNQYMTLENGSPVVSEAGLEALERNNAWLQVLDESGNVVTDAFAPETVPDAYTPLELIHIYKYKDDDLTLYFVGGFESYSYLVAFPEATEGRLVTMIDPQSVLAYLSKAGLILLIVDLAVAALIGLAFSSRLTRPVYRLTERIAQLKARDFSTVEPKRPGIYRPVFANLNDVSKTLKTYEREREQLEIRRKEWMSNVSHDLKTPLASIQGYAELLDDTDVNETERRQYAAVIERKARYMKELLDDFNLTMRLQHGDFPLEKVDAGLERFVRELVIDVLNDPRFADRSLEFTSHDAATVALDHHFMKRALLNFLYNALVHNDETVHVKVAVSGSTITISDDGQGINDQDLPYIFERYYRGTNTDDTIGSGLGMAISRDIIEAHGGTVDVTSEVATGTSIHINLPHDKK
ncbi:MULTISPECIES: sensor histidine kinase [Exiguobacterium]|uniref:sensor histidine kinase n=1 Tax=Exiguobacterium TaxID=33986 RepID=UPI001BE92A89|nr:MULTISPECIES: HAMP domain-containing sensor histidine kinase [Exiguobacterium]MCT4781681.1 HAMP domain-containing histidine kinase [Exiguobacterium himgiriensis]